MRHESLFLSQADFGNVPKSTIERKEMSKTIKRLAAVVVTALGMSVVTGVAANAADGDFSAIVATSSGGTAAAATATQVAGASNFVQYTIDVSNADSPMLISLSSSTASCVSADTTKATVSNNGTAAVLVTSSAATSVTCSTPTTAAGTITVSVFGYSSGVLDTTATSKLTITVVTALPGTVYSASVVTETVENVAGTGKYTDGLSGITYRVAKAATLNTAFFTFDIDQQDAAGTTLTTGTKAITASLSGVGSLAFGSLVAPVAGYVSVAAAAANGQDLSVFSDGRAGTSTLTITVNGVAVKTYVFTFYGSVASYDLVMNNAYLPAGGAAGTATVTAKDSLGNLVPDATVNFTSGTTTVATVATPGTTGGCGADESCTAAEWAAYGTASVNVTGVAKGSAVITAANATTSATVTKTVTATVTGAQINTVTWAYDKASYEPGEKATVTVTAKDSDGNPVGDDTYTLWATAPSADKNVTYIVAPAANAAFKSGIVQYSFYMPFSSGAVNFTGKLASDTDLVAALRGVSPTLQASVRNLAEADLSDRADAAADAAAEAIDAANAATDAANLAAEAADAATVAAEEARDAADAATAAVEELATQVATLMAALKAQITTLANTVAKIAKKVKA